MALRFSHPPQNGDDLQARTVGTVVAFYGTDRQGSVRDLLDGSGGLTTSAFGFYLGTAANGTFFSQTGRNADGVDHLYAYQGNGQAFLGGPLDGDVECEHHGWRDLDHDPGSAQPPVLGLPQQRHRRWCGLEAG